MQLSEFIDFFGKAFPSLPLRYYIKFQNRGLFHAQEYHGLVSDQKARGSSPFGRTFIQCAPSFLACTLYFNSYPLKSFSCWYYKKPF